MSFKTFLFRWFFGNSKKEDSSPSSCLSKEDMGTSSLSTPKTSVSVQDFNLQYINHYSQTMASRTEQYPPIPRPIATTSVAEIVNTQMDLVKKICSALPLKDEEINAYFLPAVWNLASFVHLLPASQYDHHCGVGGLFRHSLEVSLYATNGAINTMFNSDATPSEKVHSLSRWVLATSLVGLTHDVGKALTDMLVTLEDGSVWNPDVDGALADWFIRKSAKDYYVDWVGDRRLSNHAVASVMFVRGRIIPEASYRFIAETSNRAIRLEMDNAYIAYESNVENESIIYRLLKRADSHSTQKDLIAQRNYNAELKTANTPLGEIFERSLRELIERKSIKPNEPKSALYFTTEGCFLSVDDKTLAMIRNVNSGTRVLPAKRDDLLYALDRAGMIKHHTQTLKGNAMENDSIGSSLLSITDIVYPITEYKKAYECIELAAPRRLFKSNFIPYDPIECVVEGRMISESVIDAWTSKFKEPFPFATTTNIDAANVSSSKGGEGSMSKEDKEDFSIQEAHVSRPGTSSDLTEQESVGRIDQQYPEQVPDADTQASECHQENSEQEKEVRDIGEHDRDDENPEKTDESSYTVKCLNVDDIFKDGQKARKNKANNRAEESQQKDDANDLIQKQPPIVHDERDEELNKEELNKEAFGSIDLSADEEDYFVSAESAFVSLSETDYEENELSSPSAGDESETVDEEEDLEPSSLIKNNGVVSLETIETKGNDGITTDDTKRENVDVDDNSPNETTNTQSLSDKVVQPQESEKVDVSVQTIGQSEKSEQPSPAKSKPEKKRKPLSSKDLFGPKNTRNQTKSTTVKTQRKDNCPNDWTSSTSKVDKEPTFVPSKERSNEISSDAVPLSVTCPNQTMTTLDKDVASEKNSNTQKAPPSLLNTPTNDSFLPTEHQVLPHEKRLVDKSLSEKDTTKDETQTSIRENSVYLCEIGSQSNKDNGGHGELLDLPTETSNFSILPCKEQGIPESVITQVFTTNSGVPFGRKRKVKAKTKPKKLNRNEVCRDALTRLEEDLRSGIKTEIVPEYILVGSRQAIKEDHVKRFVKSQGVSFEYFCAYLGSKQNEHHSPLTYERGMGLFLL